MSKIKLVKFDSDDKNRKNCNEVNYNNVNKINKVNKSKNVKRKKRVRRSYRKFILSFFITLITIGTIAVLGINSLYNKTFYNEIDELGFNNDNGIVIDKSSGSDAGTSIFGQSNKKTKYNFAILGTDYDRTHTDFMMIGSYDIDKNTIQIMSVPRDTYTVMPQERIQALKEAGVNTKNIRSSGAMKMTEVHHHAQPTYGVAYILAQLEETFKVDFDFYVKFELEGFRHLIDEVGGVEFNVPQRMYFNDPTQNLSIDLYPGVQILNGKQAEGLVRYRSADERNPISPGYARGDLERIDVQQDFLAAFINKVISSENLLTTIPAILSTGSEYISTNVRLNDVSMLVPHLASFDMDDLVIYTMPIEENPGSYVYIKEPDTSELINIIFYDGEAEMVELDSKKLNITVLNGSYTSGLATKTANDLTDKGYNVSYIGDYNGSKLSTTEIRVKVKGMGEDLLELFPDAKIKVDNTLENDIVIVLGIQ